MVEDVAQQRAMAVSKLFFIMFVFKWIKFGFYIGRGNLSPARMEFNNRC
ncbi:hypothetical protein HMPREF9441_01872 [Paraprevotella clara YIT 11840]|uniref:Uncharacterized protein n=1 Tax=Paraprevotella clara YIT 11840 TaxID=762968 RepID=G5SR81_9BACT|nr:hypothetical protein HMPREF9441_01872 [Paraprevotella clara YIT 11840]